MHAAAPALARRQLLAAALAASLWPGQACAATPANLRWPRDLGSHPDFAIEWWYLTGRLLSGQREFGFQLTFFRSRVSATQGMTSAFAAKQLIFAHAAVTDVTGRKFWYDQRIAREGFGLAHSKPLDTDVKLRDWSLQHQATHYQASAISENFQLDLKLIERQPLLLQGDGGHSRKGPQEAQFSYYYSLPQLQVKGTLGLGKERLPVQGTAWLDHEWSNSLLDAQTVGWDWVGVNLQDGSALTAFQLRDKTGKAIWDGGSFRAGTSGAKVQTFRQGAVVFQPLRHWRSPRTGASYPVEWTLQTPAGHYRLKALLDEQELDSRLSTGAVYWEGLSALFDSTDKLLGHGYLEMTGYAEPLRLLTF